MGSEFEYCSLARKIHANAVKKGFWDVLNYHSFVADVIKEIGEFIDACKSGKVADVNGYERSLELYRIDNSDRLAVDAIFKDYVKDSTGDELADIQMLLLSLAVGYDVEISRSIFPKSDIILNMAFESNDLFMMINRLTALVSKLAAVAVGVYGANTMHQVLFCQCLYCVEFIARFMDIDLGFHIEHKMAFNANRPRLHIES